MSSRKLSPLLLVLAVLLAAVVFALVARPWESENQEAKAVAPARGDALARCERLPEASPAQRKCARKAFIVLQAAVLRPKRHLWGQVLCSVSCSHLWGQVLRCRSHRSREMWHCKT